MSLYLSMYMFFSLNGTSVPAPHLPARRRSQPLRLFVVGDAAGLEATGSGAQSRRAICKSICSFQCKSISDCQTLCLVNHWWCFSWGRVRSRATTFEEANVLKLNGGFPCGFPTEKGVWSLLCYETWLECLHFNGWQRRWPFCLVGQHF